MIFSAVAGLVAAVFEDRSILRDWRTWAFAVGLAFIATAPAFAAFPDGYVAGPRNDPPTSFSCADGASVVFVGDPGFGSGLLGTCSGGSFICGSFRGDYGAPDYSGAGVCWYESAAAPPSPSASSITLSIPGLTLSPEDGALVAVAILSVWFIGWGWRAAMKALNLGDEAPSDD